MNEPNPEESKPNQGGERDGDKDREGSSRRDFLRGRSAMDAMRGEAERIADGLDVNFDANQSSSVHDRQAGYLEQYSKNAMACEFELLFNLHQYPQSGAAAMEAFQLIDLIEDQMTVYRDHSEVSQINKKAFDREIAVERRLFELLQLALWIYEETSRAFDITASPLSTVWGFDQRQGGIPIQPQIDEVLDLVGSRFVELSSAENSIRFLQHGVRINLGGIGKGHALDRVGELFAAEGIGDFVIHGGQSSVLAHGSSVGVKVSDEAPAEESTGRDQGPGWVVGITHPSLPGVRLAEVFLKDRALGTSGTGRQGFFHQGKRYGHIIDPRTGWPSSHFLSTTVVSNSAAVSDALATAFFVMPVEEVAEYCDAHPDVSAILVSNDQSQKSQVRLDVFNFDDSDWQRLD